VTAASATAAELARRLEAHPAVAHVYYPGLAAARPERQMRGGGAILAFEPVGDPHALISAVRLITPAVSLGSVDTLIQHPGSISHRIVAPEDRASAGISEQLLRVSVGLEDVEDLWDDLERALKGI
jgi:methionine-gamma-lyase